MKLKTESIPKRTLVDAEEVPVQYERRGFVHAVRVPLSDDQIIDAFKNSFLTCEDPMGKNNMTIAFARAIERAHGIGEGK